LLVAKCPTCRQHIHRSRCRNLSEKLVRALTSRNRYRCHECGWRGWVVASKPKKYKHRLRTVVGFAVALLAALLLAYYLINKTMPQTDLPGEDSAFRHPLHTRSLA
jgi:hypothetical protein